MNAWTAAAKEELNHYFAKLRKPLEQTGADAAEVIEDIKRHIDEEIAAARLRVVTVTNLRPLLARIGEPLRTVTAGGPSYEQRVPTDGGTTALAEEEQSLERPASRPGSSVKPSPEMNDSGAKIGPCPPSKFLLFFGVFIPAATLAIEWITAFCARNIFDPIPTVGHVVLVAMVPAINLLAFILLARGFRKRHATGLSLALGFATGIGILFAIAFLPLLLPALITLMLGIGVLPLAPDIALISTLRLWASLKKRLAATDHLSRFWPGVLAGICAFLFVDMRYLGTHAALQLAANPETEATGQRLLRMFGDEQAVLRACREPSGRGLRSVLLWLAPNEFRVPNEAARRVYFQLYGRPFNSVPAPARPFANLAGWERQDFDAERGGEKVGAPVAGLSMRSSRMDATVEPNGAVSYLEWTSEFRNNSSAQAEARCEIELPPGAVVSRLTLWINGEEREAAFAGRAQVREAYQQVAVVQRRDPVLVTSSGKDKILMQCFPVGPNGGVMKVRLGMTIPLLLDENKNGLLRWPYMRERNFALDEKLEDSFWIDSPVPVETLSIPLQSERTPSGHYMARGQLNENQNPSLQPAVLIRRDRLPDIAWVEDTRAGDGALIVQSILEEAQPAPRNLVLVVDGSASMADIANNLFEIEPPASAEVVIAGARAEAFAWNPRVLKRERRNLPFEGGQDNIPALERAWDRAAENGSGAILWVHGPQPVLLNSMEGLRQRFERRPNAVRLYDLSVSRSPNAIVDALPKLAKVEKVSMHQPPVETLRDLLNALTGATRQYHAVRQRKGGPPPAGSESNLHLARLWAADEIHRLVRLAQVDAAIELAAEYQLVTEVSGAVVLETAEQYARSALQPVSPLSVPTVPEPATWILLLAGSALLFGFRRFARAK